MSSIDLRPVSVVALLAMASTAQELPVAVTHTTVPPRAVLIDAPGDGFLWAKGATYKMRFGDGAAMLVPVFGKRAPRNLPLTLRLAEARIGTRALPLQAPTVSRDGDRVVLDHGSVREVWRLAADHAEQDFVVDAAGADADIVVRLAVDTQLAAPVGGTEGGLRFGAGDLGGIHYGDAVIVDGAGRRLAQPVAFVGGALELTVPAEFVRSARGPITIDPVIRVITVDNSPLTQQRADSAYEAAADVWLVVYEEVVSAGDTDILARRFDAAGNFLDEVAVDITNDDTLGPAVAANAAASQFLVVWVKNSSVVSEIRGRSRVPSGVGQGAPFRIYSPGLLDDVGRPDVGGATHPDDDNYFVVWPELTNAINRKINGCRVTTAGVARGAIQVANSLVDLNRPAISKSAGPGRSWLVAYEHENTSRRDIHVAAIDRTGTLVATGFPLTNSNATDSLPDVAGDGGDFLVVWQSGGTDTNILGMRLRLAGTLIALTGAIDLTQLEPGTSPALPQTRPRVASHGCRWTYTYEEGSAGAGNTDVFAAVVMGSATLTHVEGHTLLSAGGSAVATGGVASVEEAGETTQPGRALATFSTVNVFAALLDGLSAGGGVTTVQTGCGGPLFEPGIAATGEPALGARFTVSLQLQAGSAAAIFIGLPLPPLPLCSFGCALGVSPILLSVPAASVTLNVPCSASLLLGQFAFQGVEVPTSAHSTCTVGVPLRMTDTLLATLR